MRTSRHTAEFAQRKVVKDLKQTLRFYVVNFMSMLNIGIAAET